MKENKGDGKKTGIGGRGISSEERRGGAGTEEQMSDSEPSCVDRVNMNIVSMAGRVRPVSGSSLARHGGKDADRVAQPSLGDADGRPMG